MTVTNPDPDTRVAIAISAAPDLTTRLLGRTALVRLAVTATYVLLLTFAALGTVWVVDVVHHRASPSGWAYLAGGLGLYVGAIATWRARAVGEGRILLLDGGSPANRGLNVLWRVVLGSGWVGLAALDFVFGG